MHTLCTPQLVSKEDIFVDVLACSVAYGRSAFLSLWHNARNSTVTA